MLFTDTWWTATDAGNTVWVSSGPDFETARSQLTDGHTDTVGFGAWFRKADGSVESSPYLSQYFPIESGNRTTPICETTRRTTGSV